MKIALVGYQVQERYTVGVSNDEDTQLLDFLKQKNVDIEKVIWDDANVVWDKYQLVILKSPWDYHDNITEFLTWLDMLDDKHIPLLNSTKTIRWNANKRYLKEIEEKGLPVIPTEIQLRNTNFDAGIFDTWKTDKVVVKPCISAGAKDTIVVERTKVDELYLNGLFKSDDFLIQPFEPAIKEGEWSFIFFGGMFSHVVLKVPKENDFRVQHQHGGSIQEPDVSDELINQAKQYLNVFAADTLYARVDGILKENKFYLMELELIEPYLFINNNTERFTNYYNALKKWL